MSTVVNGTFDNESRNVRNILEKYWEILKNDHDIAGCIPTHPGITFRRGRSLRDHLVHSHYEAPRLEGTWLKRRINGMFRCGQCRACHFVNKTKEFQSSQTGDRFVIRDFVNCKTKGLVYICTCPCPKDYVGKTKSEFCQQILDNREGNRNICPFLNLFGNAMEVTRSPCHFVL